MESINTPKTLDFQGPLRNNKNNKKNKKTRVLFKAPVLTCSGYGVHSRQIFRWLLTHKNDVELFVDSLRWGNTTWTIDAEGFNGLVKDVLDHAIDPGNEVDVSIQVMIPNEWNSKLAKYNVGVTAVVESDKCNPVWVEATNKMDLVIVPSEHARNVLMNSGEVTTRIVVVPEAYFEEIAEGDEGLNLEFPTDFNFLLYGQFTGNSSENDRKNTFNALKWICETFKNDEDVGIIIKTNSGRYTAMDKKATTMKVQNTLKTVRDGNNPRVYLLHGFMEDSEVASLYRHPSIKATVAISRGEGFCLPLLESVASGIPVIATDWSGHLDYLNKGKFIKVDYDLITIPPSRIDNQIWMAGSRWAEVKEKHFKKILKKFRISNDIPSKWAKDLQETILKEYSQEEINKKYDLVLSELL